jgi:quinol monooxygenase YgiN
MIIVSGHLDVAPADRDGYLADCHAVVEQARAAPGCLDFALSADLLAPGRINVYERWRSDEELERFRGSGPSGPQQEQILDMSMARYRVSAVEDV